MAIPDYESLMLPVLRFASRGGAGEVSTPEASRVLANEFNLSEQERTALLPSGLLVATRRGYFRLTDRGAKVLAENPSRVNNEFLDQFPEFREFRTRGKKEPRKAVPVAVETPAGVPEEVIAAQYDLQRKALASQILDTVKSASPQFFERLVVMLLVKMGYGGSLQDAGQAVGRSGDGGVDGEIKEDKLGLDTIYVQAKRWDSTKVG